ncbi:hypothetical protein ACJQWK_08305 [Exserohilum turcicum]
MEIEPETNKTAPAGGWASVKGAEWVVDRWAAYPWFVDMVNGQLPLNCSGSLTTRSDECQLDGFATDPTSIASNWQTCLETGLYLGANLGPHQLVSKYLTLEYSMSACPSYFPNAPADLLPTTTNVDKTNAAYGGWSIRPSNTFFAVGELDPWRIVSIASEESYAPKGVKITRKIPKCGESTGPNKVFGIVLKDGVQVTDLRDDIYDVPDSAVAQELFKSALTEWLECFKPKP